MTSETEQQAVVTIPKSTHSCIRVEKREFKGHKFIDIRQYYLGEDGTWHPTAKGIAIPPDKVGALIEALTPLAEEET